MERGIDVPEARKRKEIESVVTEHTELFQRISKQVHDIKTVREEQDAFVSNAKAHIKDVVAVGDGIDAVLAFLYGLPAYKVQA
jgi:CRISPR/Cas system-associated endonuclease Cas3-HD